MERYHLTVGIKSSNFLLALTIIDIHTHPDFFGEETPERNAERSAASMLAPMDDFGVHQCGLLGYNVMPYQKESEVRLVNDHTAALLTLHPDRFFGLAFINPACSKNFIEEELERCLHLPGFLGIKLELDVHCLDARMEPVIFQALKHDVPILHHSWTLNTWSMCSSELEIQEKRSEPPDIARLAHRYPNLKIIMAHLEGCGISGILEIAEYPNVWIDTSGSQPFTGTLEFALDVIGSSRILFGSDLLGRGLPSQLGRIYGAKLAPTDLENILYKNATALFGLNKIK